MQRGQVALWRSSSSLATVAAMEGARVAYQPFNAPADQLGRPQTCFRCRDPCAESARLGCGSPGTPQTALWNPCMLHAHAVAAECEGADAVCWLDCLLTAATPPPPPPPRPPLTAQDPQGQPGSRRRRRGDLRGELARCLRWWRCLAGPACPGRAVGTRSIHPEGCAHRLKNTTPPHLSFKTGHAGCPRDRRRGDQGHHPPPGVRLQPHRQDLPAGLLRALPGQVGARPFCHGACSAACWWCGHGGGAYKTMVDEEE